MKHITVAQLGVGTVGSAVIGQVLDCHARWIETFGIDIRVGAVIRRSGAIMTPGGLDRTALREMVGRRSQDGGAEALSGVEAVEALAAEAPVIVMDAGAGDDTADIDVAAIQAGGGVVLSNKAPLALPASDPRTGVLWGESGAIGRLRYEATCGAGLPVISTLRNLLDTGDEILEISGTLSGTFGAIFSEVGAGKPFSDAVRDAKAVGYTEPDPRDDLSGLDVARKGLIIARTMGEQVDLDDIEVHSLVPEHLRQVTVDEFLDRIADRDMEIDHQVAEALATDTSLKYIMDWEKGSGIRVGLRQVPRSTVLGSLQGPENIVSFRTHRYDQYPCVVSGPGAGAAVTAAGMVADMLALAVRLAV